MHNSIEVINMMNLNKAIAGNKACTCIGMTALGAILGWTTAKIIITHCCCAETLACKAKKAVQAVEDKIMP